MHTENYKITLDDGKTKHQASLCSEWDGLVCIKHYLTGLNPSFAEISELISYAILEGNLTEDNIYLTDSGPSWSDVFEGNDKDIFQKISVRAVRVN